MEEPALRTAAIASRTDGTTLHSVRLQPASLPQASWVPETGPSLLLFSQRATEGLAVLALLALHPALC